VATLVEQKDPRLAIALEQFPAAEWQRDELRKAVQEVVLDDLEAIWDRIMDGCSKEEASDISAQEKADKALTDINLVYGEVEFRTLAFCLWEFVDADAFPQADSVFYDLGSGVGRGIFAALLAHNFSKIIGVEIMEGLHEAGVKQYAHCQEDVLPGIIAEEKVQQVDQKHSILGPQVEFVCDDFNSYDWANGTVVFANSTCYDPALMAEMTRESLKLRLGTYFLTLTKPLESPAWKQIGWRICEMSWGEATIYAHIKILDPPPPTPTLTTAATATSTTAT
jgi:hypothetical protein